MTHGRQARRIATIDIDALCDALREVAAHDVVAATMLHHLESWDIGHCAEIIAGAVTAFAERDRSMTKTVTDMAAQSAFPVFVKVRE